MNPPKLLFLVTEDWYFWSHRLLLARAARDAGYQVYVATRVHQLGGCIEAEQFRLVPIGLRRRSSNPWAELKAVIELVCIYRRVRPDIVHHVALKPIIYGSAAAWVSHVPAVVNALTGLGYVFTSRDLKARFFRPLVRLAYRILLNRRNSRVILQNPDDQRLLVEQGVLDSRRVVLIRGSGVDLTVFQPQPEIEGTPVVVLASRMLWDKGIGEFVAAARTLRDRGVCAHFVLVGGIDHDNPASIPKAQLERWVAEGVIEWRGRADDMALVFRDCHIVCLPSYREGLPKVLIEAAACARPIVATDVPGCREVVRHGENGLVVSVRDVDALAQAIMDLLQDGDRRRKMGRRGREIAEREFGIQAVIGQTLSLYESLLQEGRVARST